MTNWTPEQLFLVTYFVSAISGLGGLFVSNKTISFRDIVGTILLYGGLGTGIGMLGYEYLGGKAAPWRVVGCGMLVGCKAIKLKSLSEVAQKVLAAIAGNK